MSKRSVLVLLAMAAGVAACSKSPSTAWTGPGWYLELPYATAARGPAVYAGPYSYDACEADRKSRPNAERYMCVNETKQLPTGGLY